MINCLDSTVTVSVVAGWTGEYLCGGDAGNLTYQQSDLTYESQPLTIGV